MLPLTRSDQASTDESDTRRSPLSERVVSALSMPSRQIVIIPFVRSMAHDESRFPNAHVFMPERFRNDMEHIAHKFGRPICVGRHFADTFLWAVFAKVLAEFKIDIESAG